MRKPLLLLGLLWLSACRGVLEVSIEREASPPASFLGKVAYIAGGDVWVVELDTNQRTRLTRDGRNSRPIWSADGQWIAYYKGDQLWALEVGAGREYLISDTPVDEFAWSPVQDQLAYLSAASGLVVWRAIEQSAQNLVESEAMMTLVHFAWDPTGKWLAYEAWGAESRLHKTSLDGVSSTLYMATDRMQIPHLASWSGDGRWLLVWMGPASALAEMDGLPLCLIAADGGTPRCLREKMLLKSDWLSCSPEGSLVLIAGAGRETWINKGLAWMNPEDMKLNWLVKPEEQAVGYPAWSPDGKSIAYSASPFLSPSEAYSQREAALAGRRIWLMDFVSGRRSPLTRDERYRDERPLWSADGQHILFARISETGASLWLMEADGDSLQQVVDELTPRPDPLGDYGYIDWSAWYDWWRPGVP